MSKSVAIYIRQRPGGDGTDEELVQRLRRVVESQGDLLAGLYTDDARRAGRDRNAGWRALMARLGGIQQIVLAHVGDLPGRSALDLLSLLSTLSGNGVGIAVPSLGLDTGSNPESMLALIRSFRAARRSAAIKAGIDRARRAGRRVGRPPISPTIRHRIVAALLGGEGVRATARKFGISPASVIAMREQAHPNALCL